MDIEKILRQLNEHSSEISNLGIETEQIISQLEIFEGASHFVEILKPCKVNDGIFVLDKSKYLDLLRAYQSVSISGRLMKFVPASGAATRMFKDLWSYSNKFDYRSLADLGRDINNHGDAQSVHEFISNIKNFAFFNQLSTVLLRENIDLGNIRDQDDIIVIIKKIFDNSGLGYSDYPKGAILFHKYFDETRTAFEEHIFEAVELVADQTNQVKIHFTISEEHTDLFKRITEKATGFFKNKSVRVIITFSHQRKSTNTISVTPENKIFTDRNNRLVFRPAGHGALIENLNEIDADIVLIKNIDNILPSTKNEESIKYKKLLIGYLVLLQRQIFEHLRSLKNKKVNEKLVSEIKKFGTDFLSIQFIDDFETRTIDEKAKYLFDRLNRPLRVCGMVKNEGHPGGGPFWVKDSDGQISIQIVEEAQINKKDKNQSEIFESATHFNPVDMVCAVRDYKGKKFDLKNFVDVSSGLITTKTYDGKTLKALELPGLWNGAMAYWNTAFVEIPASTFNPVKEINDLLKPAHQL
jgi:hypothetical protein